jgi:hypothetical protein
MIGLDDDSDDWYTAGANREAYEEFTRLHTEAFPPGRDVMPLRARELFRTLAQQLRLVDLTRCSFRFRNAFNDYVDELKTLADASPNLGDVATAIFGGWAAIPRAIAKSSDSRESLYRLKVKRRRLYDIAHP